MQNLTLLRVIQTYTDYVDGFEVDSIYGSDEAMQCTTIAEHVYYTIIDKVKTLQFKTNISSLEAYIDPDRPNILKMPRNVSYIQNADVKYNASTDGGILWKDVKFVQPDEFLTIVNGRTEKINGAKIVEVNSVPMVILDNKFPDYCTTFDDELIVFDSYHSDYDTTLQESKSMVVAQSSDSFIASDDFIIPLPSHMHSGYLDMVITEAAQTLRGISPPGPARRARAFWAKLQEDSKRLGNSYNTKRKYGRR